MSDAKQRASAAKARIAQRVAQGPQATAGRSDHLHNFDSTGTIAASVTPVGFKLSPHSAALYAAFSQEYYPYLAHRSVRWDEVFASAAMSQPLSRSNKLKRFVRKGIPDSIRGHVWLTISGARQKMLENKGFYDELLKKTTGESEFRSQIELDLHRTFPDNEHFLVSDDPQSKIKQMNRVLLAYSFHNPKIGYCQGMNYLCGLMLLVTQSEEGSFWLLVCLLERIVPCYYEPHMKPLKIDQKVLEELVAERFPELAQVLEDEHISLGFVTMKWFLNLFIDVLPYETVLRVWDTLLYEGDKVLFRISLTLIAQHEKHLLTMKGDPSLIEEVKKIGRDCVDCNELIKTAFNMRRSVNLFAKANPKYPYFSRGDIVARRDQYYSGAKPYRS